MSFHNAETDKLVRAILSIKSERECYEFLEDLCTVNEIVDMSQRLQVAMLLADKTSYQKITELTNASTTTISRVSKSLVNGNGYKEIIARIKDEKND
ncbi:MAG: YerC/YecD family TrpR-related protein [Christensenellaceae bacterium]